MISYGRRLCLAPLIVMLLLFTGCAMPSEEEILAPDLLKPASITYKTIQANKGSIQNILTDYCVTSSAVQHELAFSDRSGYLTLLEARVGQRVNKGDILAQLDTASLELDIARQEIAIKKLELARNEAVNSQGSGSYTARQSALDLEMAELNLTQLQNELAKATIISPIDGEVVFVGDFAPGDHIPGRKILVTVADTSQMNFTYSGSKFDKLQYGMEAIITIAAEEIPVKVSQTPHTVPQEEYARYKNTVLFSAEEIPENIRVGQQFKFSVLLEEKNDVIILPREAVSNFMGQYYVQVLDGDMRVDRDVEIGVTTAMYMEIVSGLREGETIITGME